MPLFCDCGGCARCLHAQGYEPEHTVFSEPVDRTGRCLCGHWGSYREDRQAYECDECYQAYDAQGRRPEKPVDPDLPVPTEMDQIRR